MNSLRPPLPASQRLYAIGDIHGRLDLLKRLIDLIRQDIAANPVTPPAAEHELIFLGDYIDRGVDSKGVIEFLLKDLPHNLAATFLRGNHEDVMLKILAGEVEQTPGWLTFGGAATLASYGINPYTVQAQQNPGALRDGLLQKLPPEHLAFLKDTAITCERGPYYFVHAGVRPGITLDRQHPDDCLWIRESFLSSTLDHGKTIIHGHSILHEPDIQPNRIGIDTGAYATGKLTALALQGATRRFLTT